MTTTLALVSINVPDGVGGCLESAQGRRFAEMIDGKLTIRMSWLEFRQLVTSRDNSHLWIAANADAVAQLANFRF